MIRDLRHAIRRLLHDKAWTSVVVVSLALGIGANTALFSAVNGLLLHDVAVQHPETLVRLRLRGPQRHGHELERLRVPANGLPTDWMSAAPSRIRCSSSSSRTTARWRTCSHARPFGRVNVVVDGQAEIATAFITHRQLLSRARRHRANPGRTIVPEDDQPTAPPVAVISSRYWRTRFAQRSAMSSARPSGSTTCRSRSSASSHRSSPVSSSRWASRPTSRCRSRSIRSSIDSDAPAARRV